eukprot:m.195468 g.195468  ORF g.195468 m.195468 type:complete len:936 (-) comp17637_c0_seq4:1344-4151(-)
MGRPVAAAAAASNTESTASKDCSHVKQSAQPNKLKKVLPISQWVCEGCHSNKRSIKAKSAPSGSVGDNVDESAIAAKPPRLLVCLGCGYVGCDDDREGHIHKHAESSSHRIVFNLSTWNAWCNKCEDYVSSSQEKVAECVDIIDTYMERYKERVQKAQQLSVEQVLSASAGSENIKEKPHAARGSTANPDTTDIPPPRGLTNLGQTCYFNAVMQSLCNLDVFVKDLASFITVPAPTTLSALDVRVAGKRLVPMQLSSPFEAGPLAKALSADFSAMRTADKYAHSPKGVIGELERMYPRFRFYQQEDSQELLRKLLDALDMEERHRKKFTLLAHFGLNPSTKILQLEPMQRDIMKAYLANSPTMTDNIFAGRLSTTVLCHHCQTVTRRADKFLDLSLSIDVSADRALGSMRSKGTAKTAAAEPNKVAEPPKIVESKKEMRERKKKAKAAEKAAKKAAKAAATAAGAPSSTSAAAGQAETGAAAAAGAADAEGDADADDCSESSDSKSNMLDSAISDSKSSIHGHSRSQSGSASVAALSEGKRENGNCRSTSGGDDGVSRVTNGVGSLGVSDAADANGADSCDKTVISSSDVKCSDANGAPARNGHSLAPSSAAALRADSALSSSIDAQSNDSDRDRGTCGSSSMTGSLVGEPASSSSIPAATGTAASAATGIEHGASTQTAFTTGCKAASMTTFSVSPAASAVTEQMSEEERLIMETRRTEQAITQSLFEQALMPADLLPAPHISPSITALRPSDVKPGVSSVEAWLDQFCKPETLDGDNMFSCEHCYKVSVGGNVPAAHEGRGILRPATKRMLISNPPAVLTLHLKRFEVQGTRLRKVTKHVEFAPVLDIAPFCTDSCSVCVYDEDAHGIRYELLAVIVHQGQYGAGHYVAYVRKQAADGNGHAWFFISDGLVRQVKDKEVYECQAYMLFYKRIF